MAIEYQEIESLNSDEMLYDVRKTHFKGDAERELMFHHDLIAVLERRLDKLEKGTSLLLSDIDNKDSVNKSDFEKIAKVVTELQDKIKELEKKLDIFSGSMEKKEMVLKTKKSEKGE